MAAGSWKDDGAVWVYGLAPHRDIVIPALADEYQEAGAFVEQLGIKAHSRNKRVVPHEMSWHIDQDSIEIRFNLPVGAYATTVLEELVDIEDAQS